MKSAAAQMRKFAERLIAEEAKNLPPGDPQPVPTFAVAARLRPQLVMLMGTAGYRALVSRALVLAAEEVKWLNHVRVNNDGALEGMEEVAARLSPDEAAKGRVSQLAHLLELLVSFIGEALTVSLVREVYPKLSDNDFNFAREGENEKTKQSGRKT
jgi:hypothetical protein